MQHMYEFFGHNSKKIARVSHFRKNLVTKTYRSQKSHSARKPLCATSLSVDLTTLKRGSELTPLVYSYISWYCHKSNCKAKATRWLRSLTRYDTTPCRSTHQKAWVMNDTIFTRASMKILSCRTMYKHTSRFDRLYEPTGMPLRIPLLKSRVSGNEMSQEMYVGNNARDTIYRVQTSRHQRGKQ